MSSSIQLVLQVASSGSRLSIPGNWSPKSTLQQVMDTIPSSQLAAANAFDLETTSLRCVHTSVPMDEWATTMLKHVGITSGRALLVLQTTTTPKEATATTDGGGPMQVDDNDDKSSGALDQALQQLFQNNYDVDSKACIVTLCKVLDNVLQKPDNPKVRTIRLANPAFAQKVASRKGGVDYLLACGFVSQQLAPALLSTEPAGEDCLVLPPENESTSHLITARRLLVTKAIQELDMTADELPKYKPPPKRVTSLGSSGAASSKGQFDIYRGHYHDAKSAAAGKNLGPDANYVSSTAKQLHQLQSKQDRLEKKMHKQLLDRELVASLPNSATMKTIPVTDAGSTASDGSLLAAQLKRNEEQRRQREEGGFTTKAMRDLAAMKKQKVYSHATLLIKFTDGSSLSSKFLPKETIGVVRNVILENCLTVVQQGLDFDLYVAPPRRKLDWTKTLQEEGLVPAAKVFCSWKARNGPDANAAPGSFLKPELFIAAASTAAYPSAQPLMSTGTETNNNKASVKRPAEGDEQAETSKEEALLKRMMGGGGKGGLGGGSKKKSGGGSGKPKWFKG